MYFRKKTSGWRTAVPSRWLWTICKQARPLASDRKRLIHAKIL